MHLDPMLLEYRADEAGGLTMWFEHRTDQQSANLVHARHGAEDDDRRPMSSRGDGSRCLPQLTNPRRPALPTTIRRLGGGLAGEHSVGRSINRCNDGVDLFAYDVACDLG